MDQPEHHDPSQACSFCGRTIPAIAHLFRAADGPSICDACVDLLADDLRTLRRRDDAPGDDTQAPETMALPKSEWTIVVDELRRLGYAWIADHLRNALDGRPDVTGVGPVAIALRAREARLVRRMAEALAIVVETAGAAAVAEAERFLRDGHPHR
jgi:hypothetical protein